MSSDSGSDIELQSALSKKKTKQKMPKSPSEELLKKDQEPKKLTTKDMIIDALTVLHTRKGVSLYAVKKFMTEKYSVNPDKISYLLKKSLKSEVEKGSIIQTKGIGATGSFKLAPKKKPEKPAMKKPPKKLNMEKETKDKPKAKKAKVPKAKKETEKSKPKKEKTDKSKQKKVEAKISKTVNKKEKTKSEVPKAVMEKGEKKIAKEKKMAKEKQTPAKKRAAMMKRKSIGSIIKAPKMKPKAR